MSRAMTAFSIWPERTADRASLTAAKYVEIGVRGTLLKWRSPRCSCAATGSDAVIEATISSM